VPSRDNRTATRPSHLRFPIRRPRSGGRARLGLFPVIIAAFATWLILFELHLRMFPWPGKLAIFLAIFATIRGLVRRVFKLGRVGGRARTRRR